MILSGVTRMHGRFGKNLVAQMLCGSKNKKLQQWKLHQLSTYGLLSAMKQSEVVSVMDSLIEAGLLEQREIDQRRPTIHITDSGREVMLRDNPFPRSVAIKFPLARRLAAATRASSRRTTALRLARGTRSLRRLESAGSASLGTSSRDLQPSTEGLACRDRVGRPPEAVAAEDIGGLGYPRLSRLDQRDDRPHRRSLANDHRTTGIDQRGRPRDDRAVWLRHRRTGSPERGPDALARVERCQGRGCWAPSGSGFQVEGLRAEGR